MIFSSSVQAFFFLKPLDLGRRLVVWKKTNKIKQKIKHNTESAYKKNSDDDDDDLAAVEDYR